jgi:hypothetical protein
MFKQNMAEAMPEPAEEEPIEEKAADAKADDYDEKPEYDIVELRKKQMAGPDEPQLTREESRFIADHYTGKVEEDKKPLSREEYFAYLDLTKKQGTAVGEEWTGDDGNNFVELQNKIYRTKNIAIDDSGKTHGDVYLEYASEYQERK